MPESRRRKFSGGKVTGTRMTEQKTPAFPSQCQKGVLAQALDLGFARVASNLPIRTCRLGSLIPGLKER